MSAQPTPRTTTFAVRNHVVTLECFDRLRWRVSVDGHLLARFSSEARARLAGRKEARRLEYVADRRGTPRSARR